MRPGPGRPAGRTAASKAAGGSSSLLRGAEWITVPRLVPWRWQRCRDCRDPVAFFKQGKEHAGWMCRRCMRVHKIWWTGSAR